ncbi:MAG: nuclear transport factor 2 family protein [Rhodoblastus sp.]
MSQAGRKLKAIDGVQSLHKTLDVATPARARVESLVTRLIELRASGDVGGMLSYVAPDIVVKTSICYVLPLRGEWRGIAACADLLRQVNVTYENLGSRVNRLLIDGDRAALHRTARVRNRGAGCTFDIDIWSFIRFRDDLIVEFAEYPDTQALALLNATGE